MPHKVLELLGTAPCVDAEWRGRLGTAYRVLSRFMVALPDAPLSETYYCSCCGGQLRLQPAQDGTSTAISDDEFAICPIVEGIKDDDRILKSLNPAAFYRSCTDGLGIDLDFQPLENWNSAWRLGSLCVRGQRYPVYAALFPTPADYRTFLCSLSTDKPFVFIGGSYSHELEAFLAERGSCFLTLQDDFEILDTEFGFVDSASEKIHEFQAGLAAPVVSSASDNGIRYLFRKEGDSWKVVFEGAPPFSINDNLGPRYINYLLHHPGETIPALELEVEINPAKESIRTKETVVKKHDAQAMVDYAKECRRLRSESVIAREEGRVMEAAELEEQVEKLVRIINNEDKAVFTDSGQKARQNVGCAIRAVEKKLQKMEEPSAQSFGRHLSSHLSKGIKLSYFPPDKIIWS
ncbi:hypothetical protein [Tichowtungia aerotolerans]|uniref:Uncharacterized protein n=1 Tax=Tichowtungia aerotolerans TaxID=2697043 RepID=A0A6P1M8Z2_9BACT|nr:hypothetical protein [Tichowtungia aerotolerans]QHI70492.1 hypothetical protein GT409_13935 [Tichowtungia aerotolerans]